MTDLYILRKLNLKLGDTLTLLELDDIVEKYINDDDIETPLQSFSAEEILNSGKYKFFIDDTNDYIKINFKVLNYTYDENSIIEITKF